MKFIVLEVTLGNLAGAYGTERIINEITDNYVESRTNYFLPCK
jgi:hypothetical protein